MPHNFVVTKPKDKPTTTRAQRAHMARLMDLLVARAHDVRYPADDVRVRQASEIQTEAQLVHALDHGSFVFDCSQTCEIIWVVAGLDLPRKMVNGSTGTMLELPVYANPKGANIGAGVVFGPGTGDHGCLVRRPGANPLLYSHGADRSSHFISLQAEASFHRAPTRFCSIAHLG